MVSLRRFFSLCPLALAAFAALALAAPSHARADTYSILDLHSDQGYHFYGMDDSGDVILDNPACGISGCYLSYFDGSFTANSSAAPSIAADNGAPCSPSVPPGGSVVHGICNNGLDAFTGFLSSSQILPSVYAGDLFQQLPYEGDGLLYMNSLGDIVFDDTRTEAWYEALPSPAPEPSGLLLLATGTLALAFAMRRRKAHAVSGL